MIKIVVPYLRKNACTLAKKGITKSQENPHSVQIYIHNYYMCKKLAL